MEFFSHGGDGTRFCAYFGPRSDNLIIYGNSGHQDTDKGVGEREAHEIKQD